MLEPGECFGHPSLLTGMAPAFTVRAREPSVCALLAAAPSRRALGTEAGAVYVAATLRKRLTRAGHTVHGLLDVGTTPVSAIARPAVFCEPEATIGEAAAALGEEGVSALLVRLDHDAVGILTDADVRRCVATGEPALDAPRASARALAGSYRPGRTARGRGDRRHARIGRRARRRGRWRGAGRRAAVGHRPAGTRCPQPDRAASHDPRRRRRGRARERGRSPAEALSPARARRRPLRGTSGAFSASSTTRWSHA